jgi:hypothetical protein
MLYPCILIIKNGRIKKNIGRTRENIGEVILYIQSTCKNNGWLFNILDIAHELSK